jgi:hypothetical protein
MGFRGHFSSFSELYFFFQVKKRKDFQMILTPRLLL